MTIHSLSSAAGLAAVFVTVLFLSSVPALAQNGWVVVTGDWDGDGLIGREEDTDGDFIFGTIGGALEAAAASGKGKTFLIFVSGPNGTPQQFHEQVVITAAHGDVTFEAPPETSVHIDALADGDPASAARQSIPGIIVRSSASNRVVFRNIAVRNFAYGMLIQGESHVVIENCRIEHNLNHNIRVMDTAVVAVHNSEVNAAGIRAGALNSPNPGNGITFENWSTGVIADTLVNGSFGAGVANKSNNSVRMVRTTTFDNKPDVDGRVAAN